MDRETENGRRGRTVARLLALLALAAVVVALILIIGGSVDSSDDGGRKDGQRRAQQRQQQPDETAKTYVVQPNDTLVSISEKVGVPVERLEELNPEIDPQALPSGATLKLR
jgi:LysM repeat protein